MAKGITLLELLITVVVLATLILLAIPNFNKLLQKFHSTAKGHLIQHHLAKTRKQAIDRGVRTTFCGTNDLIHCERTDFKSVMIFHDKNRNNALDEDEYLFATERIGYKGSVYLRASRQTYISFDHYGDANQFGAIFLCPKNMQLHEPRRVTNNRAGRSYLLPEDHPQQSNLKSRCRELAQEN